MLRALVGFNATLDDRVEGLFVPLSVVVGAGLADADALNDARDGRWEALRLVQLLPPVRVRPGAPRAGGVVVPLERNAGEPPAEQALEGLLRRRADAQRRVVVPRPLVEIDVVAQVVERARGLRVVDAVPEPDDDLRERCPALQRPAQPGPTHP